MQLKNRYVFRGKKIKYLDKIIKFKCSIEDKDIIKNNGRDTGTDMSLYLRRVSLKEKIMPDLDLKMGNQMRKLGGNLNQIKRIVRFNGGVRNYEEMLVIFAELQIEIDSIVEQFKLSKAKK